MQLEEAIAQEENYKKLDFKLWNLVVLRRTVVFKDVYLNSISNPDVVDSIDNIFVNTILVDSIFGSTSPEISSEESDKEQTKCLCGDCGASMSTELISNLNDWVLECNIALIHINFAVVVLNNDDDEEIFSEVPSIWLTKNNTNCLWPPKHHTLYISKMFPSQEDWDKYEIEVECFCGTHAEAKQKAEGTQNESLEGRGCRIPKPRDYFSPAEEEMRAKKLKAKKQCVTIVKKRWENLRDRFVRAHREMNTQPPSGSAGGCKKSQDFIFYNQMLWLATYIRERSSRSFTLRLFCYGCGGQNRNSHIIHTLYYWLKLKSPPALSEDIITYPVRGHSFLPADRVFGRVEHDLKKHPLIISKNDYNEIYKSHGVVRSLNSDKGNGWRIHNIKLLGEKLKKINGISNMKDWYRTIFNTNKTKLPRDTPLRLKERSLAGRRGIPKKKKKSLKNLLIKQFGKDWKNDKDLAWYNDLLGRQGINIEDETSDSEPCDCLAEKNAVHI
ncbi:unnamed protein product [Brassicogethes aeneus]|uniref:MADF domain-containing protein n=1 Tax=Brassicogethes aeneus TaxID=1431903 RepID=A0A9P0BGT4_BRAAE|nr:unnamed protein product [Brassicogethes aeneus]